MVVRDPGRERTAQNHVSESRLQDAPTCFARRIFGSAGIRGCPRFPQVLIRCSYSSIQAKARGPRLPAGFSGC